MPTAATPILTVDVVLLSLSKTELEIGLTHRAEPPFEGAAALLGGYVHTDKDADTEATARRILRDKAGITRCYCEQLMTFSGPARDPRGWSATVVYLAVAAPETWDDRVFWRNAMDPGPLAFDHGHILSTSLKRLQSKGAWTNLPAFFLPERFTLSELRGVYETVLGQPLNDAAFRRKIEELGVLEAIEGARSKATARPAQLYRLKDDELMRYDRRF